MINRLANLCTFGHEEKMKKYIISSILFASNFAFASCSFPEAKAPSTAQAPTQIAQVSKPAPQAVIKPIRQPQGDWIDWPITSGDWVYRQDERGSIALFGVAGQDALVTLRCMKNERRVFVSRAGNAPSGKQMTIRTSHTRKSYTANAVGGSPKYMAVTINPADDILDALAYTRGRFAIELDGVLSIAIPSWSEVVRVAEDCR